MVDLDVLLTRPFKEFRDQKGKCYMNLVDQCNSSDMDELRKWAKIPVEMQQRLLQNVFCSKCGVPTIVDYGIQNDQFGLVLQGLCK